MGNRRVSQFALDSTFIGIFAGMKKGSSDADPDCTAGITVLGSSGEVAIADRRGHRIQILDQSGNRKRQFGTNGEEDGQFSKPAGLTSDAHGNLLVTDNTNRLQVFSPEGKHLCTRCDLGLHPDASKGIAWSSDGGLAVANTDTHTVRLWGVR
jgi:DNA-binding beta-propeller fold protein YncE